MKHDPPTKEIIMDDEYKEIEDEILRQEYWYAQIEREQEYGD